MRLLPLLLLLLGGCMPHVMHGPRVERGTTGGFVATAGKSVGTSGYSGPFVPSLYAGIRHGFVASGDSKALLLGVQVPVPLLLYVGDDQEDDLEATLAVSYADVYVQASRGRAYDAGAGALFSSAVFAPYFQVGEVREDGSGWFTTQMLALTSEGFDVGDYFMPAVAWRERGRPGTAFQVGASFAIPLSSNAEGFLFSLTFTAEMGLDRRE